MTNKYFRLTAALAATLLVSAVFAQAAGTKDSHKTQVGQHQRAPFARFMQAQHEVFQKIDLTPVEKKKIEALNKRWLERARERAAERRDKQSQTIDRAKVREQAKKVRSQYNEQIQKILTEKQFDRYQKLMKEEMNKVRKEREGAAKKKGGGGN
ncbi:MAG TPA: hypothetical protein VNI20_10705 [Fimbriimonadaceae bacterium]|nr:hypothetical protein [Fimbriimonadaceae bacterium]